MQNQRRTKPVLADWLNGDKFQDVISFLITSVRKRCRHIKYYTRHLIPSLRVSPFNPRSTDPSPDSEESCHFSPFTKLLHSTLQTHFLVSVNCLHLVGQRQSGEEDVHHNIPPGVPLVWGCFCACLGYGLEIVYFRGLGPPAEQRNAHISPLNATALNIKLAACSSFTLFSM